MHDLDHTTTSPALSPKSGWRTTEFWLHIIAIAAALLAALADKLPAQWAATLGAVLAVAYQFLRSGVKQHAAEQEVERSLGVLAQRIEVMRQMPLCAVAPGDAGARESYINKPEGDEAGAASKAPEESQEKAAAPVTPAAAALMLVCAIALSGCAGVRGEVCYSRGGAKACVVIEQPAAGGAR